MQIQRVHDIENQLWKPGFGTFLTAWRFVYSQNKDNPYYPSQLQLNLDVIRDFCQGKKSKFMLSAVLVLDMWSSDFEAFVF